jgi:hypothetical protein
MKKLLTLLLLIIITMQILPVAELSKFIDDKEYVEDDLSEVIEKEKKFETDSIFIVCSLQNVSEVNKSQNHFPLGATGLQPHPISDVTTPPPNML